MTQPVAPSLPIRRPRERHYGAAVQEALTTAWAAANGICGKRLVPFLPELVPTLERAAISRSPRRVTELPTASR